MREIKRKNREIIKSKSINIRNLPLFMPMSAKDNDGRKKRDSYYLGRIQRILLGYFLLINLSITQGHAKSLRDLLGEKHPFSLPILTYSYEAIEPAVDRQTMEIHHQKHHNNYILKANEWIEKNGLSGQTIEALLPSCREIEALRDQLGGHLNHTLFWLLLSPTSVKVPKRLQKEVMKAFGSWEQFEKEWEQKGLSHFGSGWVWLVRDQSGKLMIVTTKNQDNPMMLEEVRFPILGVDLWEHAYYLKYQNRRGEYLKAIWSRIDWNRVNDWDQEVLRIWIKAR